MNWNKADGITLLLEIRILWRCACLPETILSFFVSNFVQIFIYDLWLLIIFFK